MITEIKGKCSWDGCEQIATHIASGRELDGHGHPAPACYCVTHARVVCDENHPEYHDSCPNCGCLFGIN